MAEMLPLDGGSATAVLFAKTASSVVPTLWHRAALRLLAATRRENATTYSYVESVI